MFFFVTWNYTRKKIELQADKNKLPLRKKVISKLLINSSSELFLPQLVGVMRCGWPASPYITPLRHLYAQSSIPIFSHQPTSYLIAQSGRLYGSTLISYSCVLYYIPFHPHEKTEIRWRCRGMAQKQINCFPFT